MMADQDTLGELRLLDLSEGVAGAYAAKLFADYGADVIKVERPRSGDPSRRHGPFPDDKPHPETGALWLYLNTNKRSVTLDIAQAAGQRLFRRLVERALVIIESFPPGHLASLGLGFSGLREIKRRIVLVSITPFGQWGPYAQPYGPSGTGGRYAGLRLPAGHPAEYQAGLHAFAAAAIAAFAADSTDVPQHVDIAALEVMASALGGDVPLASDSYTGAPFRMSEIKWRQGRAPLLGEHNEAVYCGELGLSQQELARLRRAGVV